MAATSASYAASAFSKYGVIQNVQNYSSNPFWNPNSPYNQRMPQPVYAMGPDVTTDECQRIVTSMITVQCMNLNDCIGTELSEIRPTIMVQLSRMTGGNYATSCGGYIDGAFDAYKSQYANAAPRGGTTAFPTPTAPNPNATQQPQVQIKNPFTPQAPDWAVEVQDRKQELQNLQSQNGTNQYGVTAAAFPTTYADLSFTERMENEKIGYEPYKDASAFDQLKIEDMEDYCDMVPNAPQCKKAITPTPKPDPNPKPDDKQKHDKTDDKDGKYAILFSPKGTNWPIGAVTEAKNPSKPFWEKSCADHTTGMYIDDDSIINKKLHDELQTGNTDYYLSNVTNLTALKTPMYRQKDTMLYGVLLSDNAYPVVRKKTHEEAKKFAQWLQKILQGTSCNNMEIYTTKVEWETPSTGEMVTSALTTSSGVGVMGTQAAAISSNLQVGHYKLSEIVDGPFVIE